MREIEVEVTLKGGQSQSCVLPSNSELLHDLFVLLAGAPLADGQHKGTIMQLPLDDGHAAWTFMSDSLVSVTTRPPVLIQPRQTAEQVGAHWPTAIGPAHVRIDDFLTPAENADLLNYALANEQHFEGSTIIADAKKTTDDSTRKSRVLFAIGDSKWRSVFINRIKLHLPHILPVLGLDDFKIDDEEIQLTASNDGDFFKQHSDSISSEAAVASRTVTFVYYFHKLPKPYAGGDLLLYQGHEHGGCVTAIAPQNNCLVAFASHQLHEVDMVRCPSRKFSDSRFTINGWLRRGKA